jgi:uncharacterized repeat protein (TIGR03803 family)
MKHPKSSIHADRFLTAVIVVVALASSALAAGPKDKVLYEFQGQVGQSGVDAAWPTSGVIPDAAGNLYGTTYSGGSQSCYIGSSTIYPCGTVFQLTPPATKGGAWTETILYNFSNANQDGYNPQAGLVSDAKGNLYGTTVLGGNVTNNQLCVGDGALIGCGTVFELSPPAQKGQAWKETILYNFQGGQVDFADGAEPYSGVTFDSRGNLYGTTRIGGDTDGYSGIAYRLSKKGGVWKEEILYNFLAATSGAAPDGGVILDKKGNVYGMTRFGGGSCDCGAVYKLSPPTGPGKSWTETTLHVFQGGSDGARPIGSLVFDGSGNLYGSTVWGGGSGCAQGTYSGCGVVFKLSPSAKGPWKETILLRFQGDLDGLAPASNLVFDKQGNLYGTTEGGGNGNNCPATLYPTEGCGTIFRLTPEGKQWKETVLYRFQGYVYHDGAVPITGLSLVGNRKLYGTAAGNGYTQFCNSASGGMNPFPCGIVFELTLPKTAY